MISNKTILKLDTRREIYDFIEKNPGLHISEMSRRLGMPKTTLIYHINYLKKLDLLELKKFGKFDYIYPIKKIGADEKKLLKLLRNKVCLEIYLYMIFTPSFSQTEISRELEIPRTTAAQQLKIFKEMGFIKELDTQNKHYPFKELKPDSEVGKLFIDRRPIRSEKIYVVKDYLLIRKTYTIMIRNRHSFKDKKIIEAFRNYYANTSGYMVETAKANKKERFKIKSVDHHMDQLMDAYNEMFCMPFCA